MKNKVAGILIGILLAMMMTVGCAAAEKTVLLTFTGDCTLGSDYSTYGRPRSFTEAATLKGYDYFFANYKEMFGKDDCTVINLESVLSDYSSNENKSKTYRFRGPSDYVKIIKNSNIEACCLANNHSEDFGAANLKRTQDTLTANGIGWFRIMDTYTYEKDGIKIRFFAMDSKNLHKYYDWIRSEINRVKRSGEANAVVAVLHDGTEYDAKRRESQEKFAQSVILNGADLVIMHHPHVVQGIDIINHRTVCYSLGNFCFGGNNEIREEPYRDSIVTSLYSLVVQAEMHFDDNGKYIGQQITLHPAFTSGDYPHNDYQPHPVTGAEAKQVMAAVQFDTNFPLPAADDATGVVTMPYLEAVYNDK